MKLFNRRKTTTIDSSIPPEVQAYSQAEHRERMGVAWLVGVVALVISLFVLAGLFFGGRWLYRTIAGPSNKNTQTQSASENEQSSKEKESTNEKKDTTTTSGSTTTGNDKAAPSSSAPQSSTPAAPTASPTPTTGPALPHTGPDSDE